MKKSCCGRHIVERGLECIVACSIIVKVSLLTSHVFLYDICYKQVAVYSKTDESKSFYPIRYH